MELVDNYINSSAHKELLMRLRSLLLENTQLEEEFKWGMPVYAKNGKDICYIKSTKNGANIGFTKGSLLKDTANLLEGTGKEMRHTKIATVEALNSMSNEVGNLIDQALALEY